MTQQQNPFVLHALVASALAIIKDFYCIKQNNILAFKRYIPIIIQQIASPIFLKTRSRTNQLKQEVNLFEVQKKQREQLRNKRFVQRLLQYAEDNQVYLQSGLSLADLAQQMHTTPHYLSKVINKQLNHSFIDFINEYRIKTAQEKLQQAAYQHYTILAIGLAVGFNSKSTFYAAFKKYTQMTPNQYRKSTFVA